jgi:hypothetical protein
VNESPPKIAAAHSEGSAPMAGTEADSVSGRGSPASVVKRRDTRARVAASFEAVRVVMCAVLVICEVSRPVGRMLGRE